VTSPVKSSEFVFDEETKLRQQLTLVALGKSPADSIISDVTLLNVYSLEWQPNQDIVISNRRIAWVGPTGKWTGEVTNVFKRNGLFAAPGFGEPHKHIESTHLTPEYEAALVISRSQHLDG
jgi:adenine deaminase